MRKVTASAVILTAITGCSQSEVPSSNWSFDEPANSQAVGQLSLQDVSQSTSAAELPEDSNTVFQDAVNSAINSESSGLFTKSVPVDIPVSVSGRLDPLASVRSYLNATSSISDVGNRVPYSSQVYLPNAPIYTPTVVSSDTVAAWPATQLPLPPSGIAAAPIESPTSALYSSSDIGVLPPTSGSVTLQTQPASEAVSLFESRYISDSYIEPGYSAALGAQSVRSSGLRDNLPILEPAPLPTGTSVGTALLQTLAQNGDVEAAEMLAVVTAESTSAESASVEIEVRGERSEPLLAGVQAEERPSLESLLGSIPQRDTAPIITSFEEVEPFEDEIAGIGGAAASLQSDAIPAFSPQVPEQSIPMGLLRSLPTEIPAESVTATSVELAPAPELMTEPVPESITELVNEVAEPVPESIVDLVDKVAMPTVEHIRLAGYSSPLLESLAEVEQSTAALSAVYVPIPESVGDTDVTALYMRQAISALNDAERQADIAAEHLSVVNTVDIAIVDLTSAPVVHSATKKYARRQKPSLMAAERAPLARYRQRIVWQ